VRNQAAADQRLAIREGVPSSAEGG
jgi:hypothetical protein